MPGKHEHVVHCWSLYVILEPKLYYYKNIGFLLPFPQSEVERQMPGKHEHVVHCRLSKRQRKLYEEYMASAETRKKLETGGFLGMLNCLMSLRKVRGQWGHTGAHKLLEGTRDRLTRVAAQDPGAVGLQHRIG